MLGIKGTVRINHLKLENIRHLQLKKLTLISVEYHETFFLKHFIFK